MNHKALFEPTQLGPYTLKNRIVFPPLTCQRSEQPGNVPSDLMAEYYRQRAGAGFMITEGTQIEPRGQGYAWTPGIYTEQQNFVNDLTDMRYRLHDVFHTNS